ncbi:MAG TPA: superoxide dismutase family protein [Longimicrobiales bacterium]
MKPPILLTCLALAACSRAVSVAGDTSARASAQIQNAAGETVAVASLRQEPAGVVIAITASGLSGGSHGIHIHTVGTCAAAGATPFGSAGGHFNPLGKAHGLSNPNGAHAGDMPNLVIGPDGKGELRVTNDRVTLTGGANALLDADGSAIVIHAGPDDQMSDPAGNSGARVACGVIH